MPTGPKHIHSWTELVNGQEVHREEPCRCTMGDDHDDGDMLSASEAEDIWLSSGMDPDYDFR